MPLLWRTIGARALGKDATHLTYLHGLALALMSLGMQKRARTFVERALRIVPADSELQSLLTELTTAPD
jgi:hypothetical protein